MTASPGAEPAAPQLTCSQCGGVLQPAEGQLFLTCPYCSSTVYIDKSRVVFHWAVACTLKPEEAQAALRRWMAGNETVKDLDTKARVTSQTFQYFPLWYFRCGPPERESIVLEPAAALSVSELKQLALPAGDLLKYDSALDADAVVPDVPLTTVTGWLAARGIQEAEIRERALVHVPLYVCKYEFKGEAYTALVDGASGRVFANLFPAKWEVPYQTIGGAGCLLYFLLAWIPAAGYMLGGAGGMGAALAVYAVAAVLLAIPLFLAAAWISAKV